MAKNKRSPIRDLVPARCNHNQLFGEQKQLLGDIRSLIDSARKRTAQVVNAELVVLYWEIGRRIRSEILKEERADYGKQIVRSLATNLTREYGAGFDHLNLFNMIRFAEIFPQRQIVYSLRRQLN